VSHNYLSFDWFLFEHRWVEIEFTSFTSPGACQTGTNLILGMLRPSDILVVSEQLDFMDIQDAG